MKKNSMLFPHDSSAQAETRKGLCLHSYSSLVFSKQIIIAEAVGLMNGVSKTGLMTHLLTRYQMSERLPHIKEELLCQSILFCGHVFDGWVTL